MSPRGAKAILAGAFCAVFLAYAAALLYFAPPEVMFGSRPIGDYYQELFAANSVQVTGALDNHGRTWVYDAGRNAGQPIGVFIDSNSRGWHLFVFAAWKAGMRRATAFNVFVLIGHLLVPLVLLLSARLFGLERWSLLAALALGIALWFFDGYLHWCWWAANPPWIMAALLGLLLSAIGWRAVEAPRLVHALAAVPLAALVPLLNPFAGIVLLPPLLAVYAFRFRELRGAYHVTVLLALAAAAAALIPQIAMRLELGWLDNDAYTMGRGTLGYLAADFLGLNLDTRVQGGVGNRSGFRFLALGAAAISLVLWRRDRDRRFGLFAVSLGAPLAVAYLGGYFGGLGGLQPYRFLAPALLFAVIPAAAFVEEVIRRRALADLPRAAYVVLTLIALAAVPRLARDVIYFASILAPGPKNLPAEKPHIADTLGFGSIGYPRHREFRHAPSPDDFEPIAELLAGWKEERGRVLVEHWPLAEHLSWRTSVPIIGGSRLGDRQFGAADLFRRFPTADPAPELVSRYLELYAVGLVIVTSIRNPGDDEYVERLSNMPRVLEIVHKQRPFLALRTVAPVSYFKQNDGIVRSGVNAIEVMGTNPLEDVVLRFHYMSTLACEPDCRAVRAVIKADPVGFIRVPTPHPADFAIVNRY